MELLALQRLRAGPTRLGGVGPRRLRGVADDGPARGAAAAPDHPPLHRGQVLGLVDQDVGVAVVLDPVGGRRPRQPARGVVALRDGGELLEIDTALEQPGLVEVALVVGALRDVADGVAQLVEQRDVLDREVPGVPRLGEQELLLAGDDALADAGQELRVPQPAEHGARVERRPPVRGELDEAVVGQHVVVEGLPSALATALALHLAPHGVEQRPGHAGQLAVATALRHQLSTQPAEQPRVEDDRLVTPVDPEAGGGARCVLARRTTHQLGHPGRALDVGDRRLVVAGRTDPADDLAERAQRHGRLTEARQHPLDVAHEDAARADDEHAAALVAAAVGVEEEGRAVQRDDGLAGAGTAGDRDHALARRADRLVLFGLDGGDDGVHRAVAGTGELRHQRALADDREVGLGLVVEQLVLDTDDGAVLRAQHPAAYDALRGRGGGLVEHPGGGRAPVDQQHVAVGVAHTDAADVARERVDRRVEVEAAEDQPLVRCVELGNAFGSLEHHGVALDETAFVLQLAATVPLRRQRPGVLGGRIELDVDLVDVLLLRRDLPRLELLAHTCSSSPDEPTATLLGQTDKPSAGWHSSPTYRQSVAVRRPGRSTMQAVQQPYAVGHARRGTCPDETAFPVLGPPADDATSATGRPSSPRAPRRWRTTGRLWRPSRRRARRCGRRGRG